MRRMREAGRENRVLPDASDPSGRDRLGAEAIRSARGRIHAIEAMPRTGKEGLGDAGAYLLDQGTRSQDP
jgi:hypothetical protein